MTYRYYEDEPVSFSDREWEAMMDDPVYFGYACPQGHECREDDPAVIAFGCATCTYIAESSPWEYDDNPSPEEVAKFWAWADSLAVFPLVDCPHCGGSHVGNGAVERCRHEMAREAARAAARRRRRALRAERAARHG